MKTIEHSRHRSRREFVAHTCQAGACAVLGAGLIQLLEGCGVNDPDVPNVPDLPVIQTTLSSGVITLTVDSASPLSDVGGAALVRYGSGSLLAAHTAQDTFVAVTAVCTHQSCEITGFGDQRYTCRCHGSQFTTSGQATRGPASNPLRLYPTEFSTNELKITVS